MDSEKNGAFARIMRSLSAIEENELKATFASFAFVFILMVSYYILRPVRDAMASDWSDAEVSWLWTLNFFISTLLVAIYGFAVSRVPFRKFVPAVYAFFAASFVLFFLAVQSAQESVLIDKAFYLWVSVFALFHLSVFWTFMADTFNKNQASRLFAIIAAGASLGAAIGPLVPAIFATRIGNETLMLISAVFLLFPIPIIFYLNKLKETDLGNVEVVLDAKQLKIGRNPIGGFKDFFTSPYLLGIGLFIILYTGLGSFVYFQQLNLLQPYSEEARASIYGYRDAFVNTLTYVLAFFLTGRIVTRLGMPSALAIVPAILVLGMLIVAAAPVLFAAVIMHVALRSGNYGLTRPAREMLFTIVDRESLYKAKPVVDIVAYRGGDVIMAWFYTLLSTGIGLGLAAIAVVGAVVAALWAIVGYKLGKSFDRREAEES